MAGVADGIVVAVVPDAVGNAVVLDDDDVLAMFGGAPVAGAGGGRVPLGVDPLGAGPPCADLDNTVALNCCPLCCSAAVADGALEPVDVGGIDGGAGCLMEVNTFGL